MRRRSCPLDGHLEVLLGKCRRCGSEGDNRRVGLRKAASGGAWVRMVLCRSCAALARQDAEVDVMSSVPGSSKRAVSWHREGRRPPRLVLAGAETSPDGPQAA